jgi:F0F1-type ATP synthase membrane subunit b/b'
VNVFIKYSVLFSNLLSFAVAYGNEEAGHHEPSVFDLKYSTLNFVVLFGFLGWKLKKPLSDMFAKKAEDIKTLMGSAEKQSNDAEERLAQFKLKIKNLDSEVVQINAEYDSDAVNFAKFQHEETQTSIARMKRDIENKLEGEKKELLDDLNHEMISKVIGNAKNTIAKSPEHRKNATQKIMTELN